LIIVSNASPLIILANSASLIFCLDCLAKSFLSQEVWEEVVIKGAGLPGSIETRQASWIRVAQLANSAKLAIWRSQYPLGVGELSTLLLAMEIAADVALMDERRARLLAKAEGVPVFGTVGLLELGYRRGELADLRQVYQMLLAQGAHIDRQILDQSLAHFNLPAL
jgi:predicted nucleic acid-binding protein